MRLSTKIIVFSVIAAAAIFAGVAAYGSQASGQSTGFDSDLPIFMKRSNSALLKIVRHDTSDDASGHLDEYSLGTSDRELYKLLSTVDKANQASVNGDKPQEANMQVVISRTETQAIMKEITPELEVVQQGTEYDIYSKEVEVGGRHYSLEIMIPN